ncbi:MAG TPA: TolC family protein [Candidatus Brocadiia bacterium]|nr:TolC family protein [Candidatus Brocadiia bacterium]
MPPGKRNPGRFPQSVGLLIACILICFNGCGSYDGEKVRRDSDAEYRAASVETSKRELAQKEPLNLDDCIDIALRNNYQVRRSEIEARIASLDRSVAFANFLPEVKLAGSAYTIDRQPMHFAGQSPSGSPMYMPMQDQDVQTASLRIQMPIFTPAAWFLYAARKRGEEIGQLVQEFTRQTVMMEVTAQYFNCLSLRDLTQAARSHVSAARQFRDDVEAMRARDLASDLEVEEARTRLLARETDLGRLERAERSANIYLMGLMGLRPIRPCILEDSADLKTPEGTLSELIAQAMFNHPLLKVADRNVEINRQMVKIAIADFLPSIVGFGDLAYTTDSFTKYSTSWTMGLSGVMTVFNGFANVNRYKIAREREKEAWLRREEACLTVILQILRAQTILSDARADCALARKNAELASMRLSHAQQAWKEGLVSPTELAGALAARDYAEEYRKITEHSLQISIATLRHAMGEPATDRSGKEDGNEK